MKNKKSLFFAIALGIGPLAFGQAASDPATQPLAASINPPVVLKNPTILRDGKLVELQGQWLFAKDGTPVFVPTEPISTPAGTAPQRGGGHPFVLLVPAGGSVYPVQYQYFMPGAESVRHYHPYSYSHYRRGYYRTSGYGGYGRHYRPYRYSTGRARFGYRSDGALVLLPSYGRR